MGRGGGVLGWYRSPVWALGKVGRQTGSLGAGTWHTLGGCRGEVPFPLPMHPGRGKDKGPPEGESLVSPAADGRAGQGVQDPRRLRGPSPFPVSLFSPAFFIAFL